LTDQFERYRWLIIALLAVPLLSGIAYLLNDRLDDPAPLRIEDEAIPTDMRVYITGSVQYPGVYPVEEGDRWIDAVEAAGGPTDDADLNAVNLSRHALDEDHIYVPSIAGANVTGAGAQPLVNINTADQAELESLPGIGEVRAQSIVQSRTTNGPYGSIEDLLTREIIPQSVYADIAPLITVSP
jgi:competence protein ComEA